MEAQPLVSIIMPTYNSERFVIESINSVKKQTYANWELIIVDDCSTDNTVSIIQEFIKNNPKLNINIFTLSENSGAAIARNTALQKAKGKFVAFLDSDDIWYPEKLEKQITIMMDNNYSFTYTNYDLIDEYGQKFKKDSVKAPETMTYKSLLKNTAIGCLTVILDREKLGTIYMPNIRAGQDTACWLQILKKGEVAYNINETLASYRIVKGSLSHNKFKALKRTWNIYRKVEKFNIIKSMYYFGFYATNAVKKRLISSK